ncbi:TonB-dependent receptor [Mucilaginibacter sp. FT3.2]|uniref:TonB-dependent receptor n=1 Tax=Mucilaginibacter sp. FT3.2 TaxID=2723090 RepID=UPI00182E7240|nr:TonB-dependent receptor [Mucilaginibacter sp. FT3.2]MBB6235260.1 TonB-linked SusC/RagA family outer membrane protein [Mucilaginibacter sp. FT3.2]
MKLTLVIMIGFLLQVSAKSYGQRISLSQKNVSLEEVFREIQKQTKFNILCDAEIIQQSSSVSVNLRNATIQDALSVCFAGKRLTYVIDGNTIVVKRKTAQEAANESQAAIVVSGFVTDDKGLPLPGVTVGIKGTYSATSTDVKGKYTISAPSAESILVFSFIGFETAEVPVGTQTIISVKMKEAGNLLTEVAVVGYGVQRKISLIGAQSTVNVEELKLPTSNITSALAGRISGVVGVQRSGEPGKDLADIWIRGVSTFGGASSNPLVLVDGVERSINQIDPEDIASFTILKDASSTAVYGVRGANGVVLVQTKRGKVGKTQIYLDYNEGVTTFTKRPQLADGVTYMNLVNEALTTRGSQPKYTQDYINNTANKTDPLLYPNVDWLAATFNKLGYNRRANFNASGGVDNAQYYVSVGYYNEGGFLKTDDLSQYNSDVTYTKYNFTSNLNLKLSSTTKLDLGVQGYAANSNGPAIATQDIFVNALSVPPVEYPISYPGGFIPGKSANGGFRNPYADLTRRGYNTDFDNAVLTNLRMSQDLAFFTKGLSATAMFSFDNYSSHSINRSKRENTYFPDINNPYNADGTLNLVRTYTGNGNYLSYNRNNGGSRQVYTEASINYDRSFGKHRVTGLALGNARDEVDAFASDFSGSIPHRYLGLAGRGTYSYDDRYFFEANFGYNGSENFDPKRRFGFFPSLGIGWVASNEKFFEPIKDAITFLKFRYSNGYVGSDDLGNGRRFGYLTLVSELTDVNNGGYTFGKGFENSNGINVTDYGVSVSWAKSHKQDLGMEVKTLHDNLSLIVDLFKEHRTGIFLQRQSVPNFVGLSSQPEGNLGIANNKGIDATLEYNAQLGKVNIGFRGTFTYNKAIIVEDDRPTQQYPWLDHRGQPILARYGYQAVGLFKDQADIDASAVPGDKSKVLPGDIKYKDLNGDGLINAYDQTKIGNGDVPSTVYGFGVNVAYKGFYVGAFFQGVANADVELGGAGIIPFNGDGGETNVYSNAVDRWTPQNPSQNVFYPRLAYGDSENFNNSQASSWWVKDVGFIRLKTAEFGYTLPADLFSKFKIKNARIYLIGYNLLTFSKFKLWDPELNTDQNGRADGAKYPSVKTVSLGLNLKF